MDVDGITVAAAQAIKDASVVSGYIAPASGHLILVTAGGEEVDAGDVVPNSIVSAAIDASNHLIFTREDGTTVDAGLIKPTVDQIYPVGSVYTSVVNVNPGTIFGGIWSAFAAGRTLVGVDPGQTEFDIVQKTGGAKTHTLTTAEMPAHTHTIAHTHTPSDSTERFLTNQTGAGNNSGSGADFNRNASQNTSQPSTPNSGSAGSGQAHNNLQPYITVYYWLRTA